MTLALLLLVVKPFQFVDDSKHLAVSALVVMLGAGGLVVSEATFAASLRSNRPRRKQLHAASHNFLLDSNDTNFVASFQSRFAPHATCLVAFRS